MILYFSGTGNSRWAARQLAEHLGDGDIVSVNDALRQGSVPALRSERPFVVVAPTYAWRLPRVVDAWLRDARLEGSRDVYFVLTCGGSVGNAAKHARALCRDKGLRYRGLAEVVMPENYVALYDVPDEETCKRLLDAARSQLEGLAARIAAGEPLPEATPDREGPLPQRPGERGASILRSSAARRSSRRTTCCVARPVRRALPAEQHRARRGPARVEGHVHALHGLYRRLPGRRRPSSTARSRRDAAATT